MLTSELVARDRPVFQKDLGDFLRNLRKSRGWTCRGAASIAQRKGFALKYQGLFQLEKGTIKHPNPEALRAIADLYDVDYHELVSRVMSARYSLPPPVDEAINPHANAAGSTDAPTSDAMARLASIQRRDADLAGEVHDAIRTLTKVAASLKAPDDEDR